MHEGHRMRMLDKLKESPASMAEHELLEILLFNALPRVNTNPLSYRLIEEFGGIKGVFGASFDDLLKVKGLGKQGAAYLKCIGLFYERHYNEEKDVLPEVYTRESFYRYLFRHLQKYTYEVFEVYAIAPDNKITRCKAFTERNNRGVNVEPKEMVKVIAENTGKSIIIVHNHVNCSCEPSKADDEITKQCEVLCSINNVMLLDHIICSDYGLYSYYKNGKMSQISNNFHISKLLEKDEDKNASGK